MIQPRTIEEYVQWLRCLLYDLGICPDCGRKLTEHGLMPFGGMDCPVPSYPRPINLNPLKNDLPESIKEALEMGDGTYKP